MVERNVDISLQLPRASVADWEVAETRTFLEFFNDYLEPLGLVVDDTGRPAQSVYGVGTLHFILHLAHNPWAQVAGGYIAMKALDATAGGSIKRIVVKLASAGNRGISGLYVELRKRLPRSHFYIILGMPNDAIYKIPEVDTQDAMQKIVYDIEKERVWTSGRTALDCFDAYSEPLEYYKGEWSSRSQPEAYRREGEARE